MWTPAIAGRVLASFREWGQVFSLCCGLDQLLYRDSICTKVTPNHMGPQLASPLEKVIVTDLCYLLKRCRVCWGNLLLAIQFFTFTKYHVAETQFVVRLQTVKVNVVEQCFPCSVDFLHCRKYKKIDMLQSQTDTVLDFPAVHRPIIQTSQSEYFLEDHFTNTIP